MFFIFFAGFLLLVTALAVSAAGWCLDGRKRTAQALLICFNLLLVVLTAGHNIVYYLLGAELVRLGLLVLTPLFLAEIFFGVVVLLVRLGLVPLWLLRRWRGSDRGRLRIPARDNRPADPDRRRFLFGTALAAGSLAAAGYGTAEERCHTVVNRYAVPLAGLPAELEGFSVAQLSDVHLGMFYSLADWRALLEQAAALGVDALAVTGDLFDDDELNEQAAVILDEFVPLFPRGIYFCYGNHEYFRNIGRTQAALAQTQVTVLVNDAVCVAGQGTAQPLYISGVDYPRPRPQFAAKEAEYTRAAFARVPQQAVKILLAHHPDFIDDGAAQGAALVLTGHTHGGQFGLCGVPLVPPLFKYMRGLYHVGRTLGYVHNGNGSWCPFRLGCPPEIAVFTLKNG